MILLLFFIKVSGQDTIKHYQDNYPINNIFVEVAGNSYLFGSLNYERVLLKQRNFYFNGRIGIGYGNFAPTSILSAPIGFNGIFKFYHAFAWEIGVGLSFMQIKRSDASPRNSELEFEHISAMILSTGLRFQDKNGFLLRIDFTPFFNLNNEGHYIPSKRFVPWFGLSIGFRIGKEKY